MIKSTQVLPSSTRKVYWALTVRQHSQHEFSWSLHPPDKEGGYTIVIIPQMETQKHKEVSHFLKVTLVSGWTEIQTQPALLSPIMGLGTFQIIQKLLLKSGQIEGRDSFQGT